MTTNQASEKFGLSAAHIRRLLEHGNVKGIKAGRDCVVDTTSFEEYMANRSRPGRKQGRKKAK